MKGVFVGGVVAFIGLLGGAIHTVMAGVAGKTPNPALYVPCGGVAIAGIVIVAYGMMTDHKSSS